MLYSPLGRTGMSVSRICLGTMTWGQQNTEAEAHEQMDYALDQGVNFFDTAELYSVPPREHTQGLTETHIGTWFNARSNRDKVILASKVAGPGLKWIRGGHGTHDKKDIKEALDGSLKRLRTDYIDLYQIHWPDRKTNFFGKLGYEHDDDDAFTPFEETLQALDDEVKAGRIRAVGVSNETPWGLMRYLELAEKNGWPRMASVQNPYSLLNRTFEVGLAEVAIREDCPLLAYSPLAFGILSGKYLGGAKPQGARLTLFDDFVRYLNPLVDKATADYVALAQEHGIDPATMALAYVNTRRFLGSNIIGATTMDQLRTDIASIDVTLSEDTLARIESIHESIPNPAP